MPYPLSEADKTAIGKALALYYEEALEAGYRGLFDRMARANMGIVTGYLDQASDTYAGLRKKSRDAFTVTFKSQLKLQLGVMFANKNDVASVLVGLAEKALTELASKIPIPVLSTIVTKTIAVAATEAKAELHTRSIREADGALNKQAGGEVSMLYTSDTEAALLATKAMEQYKQVCNYITALPPTIATFDDAVTFPTATFKVQAAASSLNIALTQIQQYLSAMQERVQSISTVVTGYKTTLREKMPAAVDAVLQKGYADAYLAGKTDVGRNKYNAVPLPVLSKPNESAGGATWLASYLSHAVAQGYYDAGNEMSITRPRSNAVTQMPTRPRSNAIIGR